jgi:hypothetical protein
MFATKPSPVEWFFLGGIAVEFVVLVVIVAVHL